MKMCFWAVCFWAVALLPGCTVDVAGPNRPPVAVIGPDLDVAMGETATLDGGASFDPDGDPLSYAWKLLKAPPASGAGLSSIDGLQIQLTPDATGIYIVGLVVRDGQIDSERDTVQLRVLSACREDIDCDDQNPCTLDTCEPTGCIHGNLEDGESCGSSACSGREWRQPICSAGECTDFVLIEDCDDQNACTEDSCDPETGCGNLRLAEGTSCGTCQTCDGLGLCIENLSRDEDCSLCQECAVGGTCQNQDAGRDVKAECDNETFCDGLETCDGSGACQPGTFPCGVLDCNEDTNQCEGCETVDDCPLCQRCDQDGNCVDQDLGEDLKSECPGEACTTGACDGDGACGNLSAMTPCPGGDGNWCTSNCDGLGLCEDGVPVNCSDGSECTGDLCNVSDGTCSHPNVGLGEPCAGSDTNYCNSTCDGAGICDDGTARDCSDGSECTQDGCNPADGSCSNSNLNEGTPCAGGDIDYCNSSCDDLGTCVSVDVDCGDGQECTLDLCDSADGTCSHSNLGVGEPCAGTDLDYCNSTCDGGGHCDDGLPRDCADGNDCTADMCEHANGACSNPPLGASIPCGGDGIDCTADECDGAGTCEHLPNDGLCGGNICWPDCSPDNTGCVAMPSAMDLVCDDPVALPDDVSACVLSVTSGTPASQENCLSCVAELGISILDYSGFDGCDFNGWTMVSGDSCSDAVSGCVLSGNQDKTCCDQPDTICVTAGEKSFLRTDENTNCGGSVEEWRIEKTFDFSGFENIELCLDIADNNANTSQGILVEAYDGVDGPDVVFCRNDGPQPGVDDVFYPFCASLSVATDRWVDGNPSVTLRVIAHSENGGRRMYLDNISLRGWRQGCDPVFATVFSEDFAACSDPITTGWQGWTVDSGDTDSYPKCPGNTCTNLTGGSSNCAEVDCNWMILERSVDASSLDGNVELCFNYGDDGVSAGSTFEALFDAGTGWQTAWSQRGDPGPDSACREVCVNLSDLDSAVNRNPALGIKFFVDAVDDKIGIYEVSVSGAQYCDGATLGLTQLDPIVGTGGGSYGFDVRDVPGTPLRTDIVCEWNVPPAWTMEAFDSVKYWSDWCNTDYQYRKKITVQASGTAVPDGYSVFFAENTATLIAGSKLRSDGNDWRVFHWDGASCTELDRWVDTDLGGGWNSTATRTWFKTLRSIDASSSDEGYYVYYGYPGETVTPPAHWSDSMGADASSRVFLAADDFEEHAAGQVADGWNVSSGCSGILVADDAGNKVLSDGTDSGGNVYAGDSSWTDVVVRQKFRSVDDTVNHAGLVVRYLDDDEEVYGGIVSDTNSQIWDRDGGSFSQIGGDWPISNVGTAWHVQELKIVGDKVSLFVDDAFMGISDILNNTPISGSSGFWCQYSHNGYRDNHIVRKYVAPEPTVSPSAQEESQP